MAAAMTTTTRRMGRVRLIRMKMRSKVNDSTIASRGCSAAFSDLGSCLCSAGTGMMGLAVASVVRGKRRVRELRTYDASAARPCCHLQRDPAAWLAEFCQRPGQLRNPGLRIGPVAPRSRWSRFHTNFTVDGSKTVVDGVLPPITPCTRRWKSLTELTDWTEIGLLRLHHVFSPTADGNGWAITSVRACELRSAGTGRSASVSRRKSATSNAASLPTRGRTKSAHHRSRRLGPWYWSFNPALDKSFYGPSVNQGVGFSPRLKVSYDITKKIAGGFEYYGAIGPATEFDPATRSAAAILSDHRCECFGPSGSSTSE